MSTEASSENLTSRFCNHFSIIQSHHACKMCSNYPGIKLEPALGTLEDKIEPLSSYAHVVHTTAKLVISRRRKNENVFKMSKKWKARAKRAKILFFIVKYANLWGFCCRRRRGCLSSLVTMTEQRKQLSSVKVTKLHRLLFLYLVFVFNLAAFVCTLRKQTSKEIIIDQFMGWPIT